MTLKPIKPRRGWCGICHEKGSVVYLNVDGPEYLNEICGECAEELFAKGRTVSYTTDEGE